jgi:hypothetical protein
MTLSKRFFLFMVAAALQAPLACSARDLLNELKSGAPFDLSRMAARAYYREHARVRLGTERRLPNGVSWRLHTDTVSGLAEPRITWMPNAGRLRLANEMFEIVHAGDLIIEAAWEKAGKEAKAKAREEGVSDSDIELPGIYQGDIDLTYASVNLVSMVNIQWLGLERLFPDIHGITFDLAHGIVHELTACDGTHRYGRYAENGPNYLFRLGPLLRICDQASYRAFQRLYAAQATLAGKAQAKLIEKRGRENVDDRIGTCIEHYVDANEYLENDHEYVLYLTFKGLAVHLVSFEGSYYIRTCTHVSPLNPTVIPYRDLAPLMQPGPWRDELLALH